MSRYYTDDQVATFVEGIEAVRGDRTLHGPLAEASDRAASRFASTGFPTTKHEDWKYTSLRTFLKNKFYPTSATTAAEVEVDRSIKRFDGDAERLVFVNGHYRADLSQIGDLPEGVILDSLASRIADDAEEVVDAVANYPDSFVTPFVDLNTANLQDGVILRVPKGVEMPRPVHALFLSDGSSGTVASYPRIVMTAGESSRVTLFEEYRTLGEGAHFTCAIGEVEIGANAIVDHIRLQEESLEAYNISASHAVLRRDATYRNNALSFGCKLSRNDPAAILSGEGGHAAIDGLYLAGEGQTLDAHTSIDHDAAHCTSHELYKGILRESGHAVFNGKIFVREGAQKTDSEQSNMNLLLSDQAAIDTKPQLEIFADDVKCTHGATIGRLDETSLFYLRSRGIGEEAARNIMTYAFAAEVIDHVEEESIASYLTEILDTKIDH